MPYQTTPLRGSRRSAIALLTLLAHVPAHTHAQESQDKLEPLIVSALRIPQKASTVTSAVTALVPEELIDRGIFQIRDALNEVPGVISTFPGGQSGAPGSIFIRGTTTKYAQVVMDGMRLSDSNNQLGRILSGARTHNVGGIELLRGPQGAIYGGESIGGVLWMETPSGSGKPHGSTTLEAGSFHSFATSSLFAGEIGDASYYLSGGYEETDNDAPHNHYQQWDTALRVEGIINPVWTLGTTFRSIDSNGQDLDQPDIIDGETSVTSALGTLYAVGKISDRWTARFHVGYYQESLNSNNTYYSLPSSYFSDLRAGNISTDHEITFADNLRLLVGAFAHKDTYESTYSSNQNGTRYGAHSTLEWDLIEHLTTSASVRWEDYDAYGNEFTWRFGSIYTLPATGTTLRGGIGTSFRTPTYMELFSPPPGGGNPDLSAESSLGWDLGFEQKIGSHHTLEATWFQNQITDQIAAGYPTYVNSSGISNTRGFELGLRGSWLDNTLSYRLAWTYLQESMKSGGLPRNAATASLDWKLNAKSLIGIGATHLSSHTWGGDTIDGYTLARIYGSYQLTDKVKLHARLENAFNDTYYLFNYTSMYWSSMVKGAGPGLYAGITVDW
jgi:iron complex outermembrane receptor protein